MKTVLLTATYKVLLSPDVSNNYESHFGLTYVQLRAIEYEETDPTWGNRYYDDEILFLRSSGKLVSLELKVGDPKTNTHLTFDHLTLVSQTKGTLVSPLRDDSHVDLERPLRLWDRSGKSLAIILKQGIEKPLHSHWLTENFAFLFYEDGTYCGWVLKNPLHFAPDPDREGLLDLCNEFYDLTTLENIDKLEGGDLHIRQRLLNLRKVIEQSGHDLEKFGIRMQILSLVSNVLSFVDL